MPTTDYLNTLPPSIDKYEFLERSAIKEFEGGLTREQADKEAFNELINELKENI